MLVSICIPSYNHAEFLPAAIESCLNQTYKDIEIIIVDDGSSDNSLEIARQYERTHPSLIQVFTHPDNLNRGISATINLAVSKFTGDFYCGLASDDIFYPDKTERQVNYLVEHPDVGWVYSKAEWFGERSGLVGTDISTDPDAMATLISENRIWEITVMGRKEVWKQAGSHDESLVYSDWHFAILMLEISRVGFINEVLAAARVHSRNTSVGNNWKQYFEYSVDVMTALRARQFAPQYLALINLRRSAYLFRLGRLCEARSDLEAAFDAKAGSAEYLSYFSRVTPVEYQLWALGIAPFVSPKKTNGDHITANPNPITDNSEPLGKTVISWSTNNIPSQQVHVYAYGADRGESLFAGGAHGSQEVPWIQPRLPVEFRLYWGEGPSRQLLDRVVVTRQEYRIGVDRSSDSVVVSGPAHSPALLTIYSANHSGYSEDFTVRVPYQTQRWSRLRIALEHGVGVKQLRLDPLIGPGLVDIATVSLRSQTTGAVLWRANRSGGLEELSVSGTALHLPHQSLLRLLSYGDDPQVYLPDLTGKIFDEPLTLQVLLRFDPAPTNIERAVSGWNDLVAAEAEIKELRSALAFTTAEFDKSRGELRSQITETAARSKETERIQLELEARTSRFEQVSSELALLRNQLGVEHRAKVRMAEEFTRLGKELRSLKQHLDERKRRFPRKLFATKDKEKGDLGPKLKGNTSECRFWLDFPTGPTLASENVVFSGWVLPPPGEKILGVRALVQGEEVVGQYGFERSDVAAAFSDRPEGLYPGFSVAMPLSVGSHEVALQVLIGTAKWVTFYLHRHEVLAHPSREG